MHSSKYNVHNTGGVTPGIHFGVVVEVITKLLLGYEDTRLIPGY